MPNFFTGDIAEVKIFNSPLSNSERAAEEGALKCKYGLGSGAAPGVPVGLTAAAGNRQVTLSWAQTAGATGYNLKHSTDGGGSFTIVATGIPATSYSDTNAVYGFINSYLPPATTHCGTGHVSAPASL